MLHSWRHPDGKLCVFAAVSQDNMEAFESLFALLYQSWIELGNDTAQLIERDRPLIHEIFGLFRSVGQLTWDVEQICQHPSELESLLIGPESQLAEVHRFESKRKPKPPRKEGEMLTAEHLPFPTSDNPRTDQIGALLAAGWKPTEVRALCQWLSAEEVDKVLFVNNEILRADERVQEAISAGLATYDEREKQAAIEKAVNAAKQSGEELDPTKIKPMEWFEDGDWATQGLS